MLKIFASTLALGACLAVASIAIVTPAHAAFTGDYAVGNWTLTNTNADGSVDLTAAPDAVTLTGGDNGSDAAGSTRFAITITASGVIAFDWAYDSDDSDSPSFDPFGYLINGVFTQLSNDLGSELQNGSESFGVTAGDLFEFAVETIDNLEGPAHATIRGFSFTGDQVEVGVPEPGTLALFAAGLIALALVRRREAA